MAVLDFEPEPAKGNPDQALALRLGAETREQLRKKGFEILDRAQIDQVAREQILKNSGLTETIQPSVSMLKADYLIYGKITEGGVTLGILSPGQNRLLGSRRFELISSGPVLALTPESIDWMTNLMPHAVIPVKFSDPVIQPEALQAFYEGLAFYQDGKYFDAIASFSESYRLSDKFQDAYLWEALCYDALGLKLLGDAERRFTETSLVARGVSRPVPLQKNGGLTFSGITQGNLPLPDRLKVELAAINVLGKNSAPALQLPSDLAKFRDEYDAFVGVPEAEMKNWSTLPNFLTRWSLQGKATGSSIEWNLLDTLSLSRKKSVTFILPKDSAQWETALAGVFKILLKNTDDESLPVNSVPLASPSQCVNRLSEGGAAGNRALLELVLQEPDHPALWGKYLDKKWNNDDGLQGFLNFGLREYLIQKLPPTNEYRRWLELVQLRYFLPYDAKGCEFSGRDPDVFQNLKDFRKRNQGHVTAALAEYMMLWENLGKIPPSELAQRLNILEKELDTSAGREKVSNLPFLKGMVTHLKILALLASDPTGENPLLPGEPYPRRMVPVIGDKEVEIKMASDWICNEWSRLKTDPVAAKEEARAALNILGRGSEKMVIDPDWLDQSPHSIAMLSFAIQALHEVDGFYGRPIRHPFDAPRQRKEYLQLVDYCWQGLRQSIQNAATKTEVDFLQRQCQSFVCYLSQYGYYLTLGDARFESIRQALAGDLSLAMFRVGKTDFQPRSLVWIRSSRIFPDPKKPPMGNTNGSYFDPAQDLAREEKTGKESWSASPLEDQGWSRLMESDYFSSKIRPEDMAGILSKYEGRLQQLFDRPDLNQREIGFVLNYALMLFHARKYFDAEPLFETVIKQTESDLTRHGRFQEYRTNAAVYLGYIALVSGRESGAVTWLKQAIAGADTKSRNLIVGVNSSGDPQYNNFHEGSGVLRAVALRLLDEARLSIQPEALPPNILRLAIRVPELENTNLFCYVRIPKGYSAASGKKHGVLLVVPSVNQSTPEFCLDGNAWAKFADEEGLFLLSAQFQRLFTNEGSESDPRDWAGDAILQAIDQLGEKYSLQKDRLLLHGYGAGATFVDYFARWKPKRVAAVSSHSSSYLPFYEWMPELEPLSAMKNIPHFISCGENDDSKIWPGDRKAAGIQYCTFLKDAGVPVIWKSWPGVGHQVSPVMEAAAMRFLASQLRKSPGTTHYVGDLRDWSFVPAGSAAAKAIPTRWSQLLPDRTFAEIWGHELK